MLFFLTRISQLLQLITMKFPVTATHIHSEGSVSQIFYLDPSFYFM